MISIGKAAISAAGIAVLTSGFAAMAQERATVLQRSTPAPQPGQQLAQPATQEIEEARCRAFRITVTVQGTVIHCGDYKLGRTYLLVVDESQYPGAGEAAIAMLQRDIPLSNQHTNDPRTEGSFVMARFREGDASTRRVCQLTGRSDLRLCRRLISLTR